MRKKSYLNNKDLHDEIVKSQEQGELTKEAVKMFMLLAERANRKLTYVKIEDKQDCIQHATLDLLKYWKGYKPQYKNAFAYYTEIAKKGYAKAWNKLYPKKYAGTISMDGSLDDGENDGIYSLSNNY
jgi:hypothetical protein